MIQNIYRLDIQIIIIDIQTFSSSEIIFIMKRLHTLVFPISGMKHRKKFLGKQIQKQVFFEKKVIFHVTIFENDSQ